MRVSWSYLIGWTLPVAEVAIALGLYASLLPAKVAALVLLALFSGAVALVLWKGLKVPCRCFGDFGGRYMSADNLRDNGLLMLVTAGTLWLPARTDLGLSLPTAAFLLFFYSTARELIRQRRFLAGLRKQGIL
jgi:hypothetical protein